MSLEILRLPGAQQANPQQMGGKAWSIFRMQELRIPVPPAFVLGTDFCRAHYANDRRLPDIVDQLLPEAVHWLESISSKTFGGGSHPLLVAVRSGAPISMPGMMDTVLNLGLNDAVESALAALTKNRVFAADTHARFVQQFTHIVGHAPPIDPWRQLADAIAAVFNSWTSERALAYRRDRGLSDAAGTAVTVQAMVFGNIDAASGTGVLFSRDPNTGAAHAFGEWLQGGQGEDVVSGRRTPTRLEQLAASLPGVHRELMHWAHTLEVDAHDVQDIEFTVEAGKLWLLQTRAAKRSPQAALRIAVAMHQEGLIARDQALARITPEQVDAVVQSAGHLDVDKNTPVLARGRPACAGIATGQLVTDVAEAEHRADLGESIILARPTTDPDDVHVMSMVAGVLTELGGATSHAAVVCRELGVPCIVDCGAGNLMQQAGAVVTMDGAAGLVFAGKMSPETLPSAGSDDVNTLTRWASMDHAAATNMGLADLLRTRQSSIRS